MNNIDETIRQVFNRYDDWVKSSREINPINGLYFEIKYLLKSAVMSGFATTRKEEGTLSIYQMVDWYLYATAPHSDLEAWHEWYTVV